MENFSKENLDKEVQKLAEFREEEEELQEEWMEEDKKKFERNHPKPPQVPSEKKTDEAEQHDTDKPVGQVGKSAIRGDENLIQNEKPIFNREAEIDDLSWDVITELVKINECPPEERGEKIAELQKGRPDIAKRLRQLGGIKRGGKGITFPGPNGVTIEVDYE